MTEPTRDISTIKLTDHSESIYGFARFMYPDELTNSDGAQKRQVLLTIGGQSEEKWVEIIMDYKDLIFLNTEKGGKLTHRPEFTIEAASDTIEPMKLLSERVGWNQTWGDLVHYTRLDPSGNILAGFKRGKHLIPLGSGAVFPIGTDLSWISMILVHPEVRRQGIASAIMQQCLTHARLVGQKPVIGLDATPEGKQVYDSLGFKDSFSLWRCKVSLKHTDFSTSIPICIEPIRNLTGTEAFLQEMEYLNRTPILETLLKLPDAAPYLARSGDKIQGIVLSRPGRRMPSIGPLLAAKKIIATQLLYRALKHWKDNGFNQVFMDIPELHLDLPSKFLSRSASTPYEVEDGFLPGCEVTPLRPFTRMYQLIEVDSRHGSELTKVNTMNPPKVFEKILERSQASWKATQKFMAIEKEITLPHQYAIGGPEIG